jgi:hypothetical protein
VLIANLALEKTAQSVPVSTARLALLTIRTATNALKSKAALPAKVPNALLLTAHTPTLLAKSARQMAAQSVSELNASFAKTLILIATTASLRSTAQPATETVALLNTAMVLPSAVN